VSSANAVRCAQDTIIAAKMTFVLRMASRGSTPFPAAITPAHPWGAAQTNFSSAGEGCSDDSLSWPYEVAQHNGRLYIADGRNHRVVMFNSIPTTNGAAADLVLGRLQVLSDVL